MGFYLPSVLEMASGEIVVGIANMKKPMILLAYQNGNAAAVPTALYQTKSARKCLKNACGSASPLVSAISYENPAQWFLGRSESHQIAFQAKQLPQVKTRTNHGIKCLESGFCTVDCLEKAPDKTLVRKTLPSVGKTIN